MSKKTFYRKNVFWLPKTSGHFGFMPHKLLHNFGGMASHHNLKCLTSHSLPVSAAAVCYFLITAAGSLHSSDDWCPLHIFLRSKVRVNISSSSWEKCGNCYHLLHSKSHRPGITEEALKIRVSGCIKLGFCSSWGASYEAFYSATFRIQINDNVILTVSVHSEHRNADNHIGSFL